MPEHGSLMPSVHAECALEHSILIKESLQFKPVSCRCINLSICLQDSLA